MSATLPTPPTIEPARFQAGNTFTWTKDLSDFPAPDWVLTYQLRGAQTISITATQSGSTTAHLVEVSAATTANWTAGTYSVAGYVSALSSRFQIYSGSLVIEPDIATAASDYDGRTMAAKVVAALESVALNRASREEISYVNGLGISVQKMSHQEIIAALSYWRGRLSDEQAAEAAAQGRATGRRILTRFVGE